MPHLLDGVFFLYNIHTMRYLILIIFIFALWFFAGSFVHDVKGDAVSSLNKVILWPRWWLQGLASPALNQQEQKELQLENKDLKARLWRLEKTQSNNNSSIISAKIHSRYPFNDKSIISISAGKQSGVSPGMAVTVKEGLLIGKVTKAFSRYSLVETIFNPDWQLPIRIGEAEIESLLTGGSELKVTLIAKDKKLESGDRVFAASKDFPYGLTIGDLEILKPGSSAGVFHEAVVKVPYNLNELSDVRVIKKW